MKLRPYQQKFVDSAIESMDKERATLGVMATGLGKTVAFAHVADRYIAKGKVLVLAHRKELIYQACKTLRTITGIEPEIEMADMRASDNAQLIVSTFQSQYSGREPRYNRFDPHDFALVITDEAHHVISPSFRAVVDYYLRNIGCHTLGVTATPDRSDGAAMGRVYKNVCYEYGIKEGIADGWLVPIRATMHRIRGLDFKEVNTVRNFWGEEDFSKKDLDRVLSGDKHTTAFAHGIIDAHDGGQGIVFCAGVSQAEKITDLLNTFKPDSARCIFGKTDKNERAEIVKGFISGEFAFLVNVQVATEGFDAPNVSTVYLCSPTKSRSLYAQMVGRGTRPVVNLNDVEDRHKAIADSKKPCMRIVDFSGASGKLKLVSPADILGGDYDSDMKDAIFKALEDKTKTLEEALTEAEAIVEEEKAKAEERMKHKIAKLVSEGKVEMVLDISKTPVNPFDLLDVHPDQPEVKAQRGEQATDAQTGFLDKHNIDTDGLTKREASEIIAKLMVELEKPSEKQIAQLKKRGYPHDPIGLTRDRAQMYIKRLAANNWQTRYSNGKTIWE